MALYDFEKVRLCKHFKSTHFHESKLTKFKKPIDFKVNVFFGKSTRRETDNGNTINSCVDLLDHLLESEKTDKTYDYYSKRIAFTWECDDRFIIQSIIGDYCDLYLKTAFSKMGKNPRICKWDIFGIKATKKKSCGTYEKLATLTMSDYNIKTEFHGSFRFSDCILLACVDAK